MSKRLTIEYVRWSFEKKGYILLTTEYINAKQKLDYICPKGHIHSMTWGHWQRGQRCFYCFKEKLTIDLIKDEFKKDKFELLTKIYINNTQKLDYICPKGHIHSITWSDWQQNVRCPYCSRKAKLTIEFIRESFEKEKYILLTKVYINVKQKLDYICPKGHKHSITWGNWQQGQRCFYCFGKVKPTIEFIRESFEKEKYILLTKVYINFHQKLEYICPEGHRHSITWGDWKQGQRCFYCFGNIKPTIEFVNEAFKKYDYELLTKVYIDSHQKLDYICSKGHKHSMNWNSWQCGHRCPTCWKINNSGSGNSNWKGGISKEPYCQDWTNDLKDFVKERDGHKCLNPYCLLNSYKDLTVHHIDYNKKSCGPENLITVCRSCNSRANKDRKWHEAWYKAILHRRYNYIYI